MTDSMNRNNNNNRSNGHTTAAVMTNMSTMALESKLKQLRDRSNSLSATLTQKLASSQSGQDLLHIGTSLSTLPPDLHLLLTELHPLVQAAESTQDLLKKEYLPELQEKSMEIKVQTLRITQAMQCAELHQDLLAAEEIVDLLKNKNELEETVDHVDLVLGLERAALVTVCLIQELESSTSKVSNLTMSPRRNSAQENENTEQAQFVMKLSKRIRSCESNVITASSKQLEECLMNLSTTQDDSQQDVVHMKIGHCMRGLAYMGRGNQVESIFARVAIMPLVKSKLTMGNLDAGGNRGECTGLFSLLDDICCIITEKFGSVLILAESMFEGEVDLVTSGVWVPIATALMADAGIKMAIFSPGIASVLQANYSALDTFLSELAGRLLQTAEKEESKSSSLLDLYFEPQITSASVEKAQKRIYRHAMTGEFSKRWNLPIYYQLRFGESCTRLNKALDVIQLEGWDTMTTIYTGGVEEETLRNEVGLELPVFLELHDILQSLWRSDVILRPLSHRFLRGAVQLVGRMIAFVREGLEGKIQFGQEQQALPQSGGEVETNGVMLNGDTVSSLTREAYYWGENLRDVAIVAWDLTVLETMLTHDYVETVCKAICDNDDNNNSEEMRQLTSQVLTEASGPLGPLVSKCWNDVVVKILITKCCGPLAAVKGVGATYRMTNRPPPTQASPFVSMILRPLQEFYSEFENRTPPQVGMDWKLRVIVTVSHRYTVAVEELLTTVQRTEAALRNRSARRGASSGGMSDGDKVKLQLYLDYQGFSRQVESLGIGTGSVEGLVKLRALTFVEGA